MAVRDSARPRGPHGASALDAAVASGDAGRWLLAHRARCDMTVRPVALASCTQWALRDGAVRHHDDAFFSIVGVRAAGGSTVELPLIDQPEIGILGFVYRRAERGAELLLQAKPEPGNVGLVQLAPTVQATESNYRRRHGGRATPLLELFGDAAAAARRRSDSLQSEQGSRFLRKLNRNVLVEVEELSPGLPPALAWFPVDRVIPLLGGDFSLNTDARSVLASSPWRLLAARSEPFARSAGVPGLAGRLAEEYSRSEGAAEAEADAVATRLEAMRGRFRATVERVELQQLSGFRCVAVTTSDREVRAWDQPLARPSAPGAVTLLAQRRGGRLEFLLVGRPEIGLRDGVELAPSVVVDDHPPLFGEVERRSAIRRELAATAVPAAHVWQSDEGGRFDRSRVAYSVAVVPEHVEVADADDAVWVGLATLEALARRPQMATNELRTVISLLLRWV